MSSSEGDTSSTVLLTTLLQDVETNMQEDISGQDVRSDVGEMLTENIEVTFNKLGVSDHYRCDVSIILMSVCYLFDLHSTAYVVIM